MKNKKYEENYIAHVFAITSRYFEVSPDLKYVTEINEHVSARRFIRELILPIGKPKYTPEQKYLRSLLELHLPMENAKRARLRIVSSKPKARSARASSSLIHAARDISFECYHFQERLKDVIDTTGAIYKNPREYAVHKSKLARVVRDYKKNHSRILSHRNFLVHGPSNRIDEFEDLRLVELSAEMLHDDIWFEHANVFEEIKQDWIAITQELLRTMSSTLVIVQHENENAIERKSFTFMGG